MGTNDIHHHDSQPRLLLPPEVCELLRITRATSTVYGFVECAAIPHVEGR